MSVPQWTWELARAFRRETGLLDLFPVNLRAAVAMGFDLTVDERPGLTVADVSRRLARAGCTAPTAKDRPLRACLVAARGAGWIFLDAADPLDEQDYSLAHEIAHFLRHHWAPRRRAAALGRDALQAFDTGRSADDLTRLRAYLRDIPICGYSHLMERCRDHLPPHIREAEEEADLLACELLAPEDEVRRHAADRRSAAAVLASRFGLPAAQARAHAARLFSAPARWPLLAALKKAHEKCRNAEGPTE